MVKKLDSIIEGIGETKGFVFIQVLEYENGYIYKVETGKSKHYEAFHKKETPLCIDFEKRIYSETEKKEVYPKAKDFGVWAWTCKTLDKAKERLSLIE